MTDTANRPMRQEQEPASEVVVEVAPGVLRSQLPISLPGLGHVNCYLLEDDRGVAIVDPGLPTKASYAALESRLRSAGYPITRVHTVIITHSHFDHFGGAKYVRSKSGAEIVTHRRFRTTWDPALPIALDSNSGAATPPPRRYPWEPTPWGGPGIPIPRHRRLRLRAGNHLRRLSNAPTPTLRLDDAETIRLAGREWVAVHTPGHTDDHLCLFDPVGGCMLCGDHVLPTITPHIGGLGQLDDPLQVFFDSLDKVAAMSAQVSVALPAHGHPFADLAGRVGEIKRHHADRLGALRSYVREADRQVSVMDMAAKLFSARAQGAMADSETFAHLEHLRILGELTLRNDDGVMRYSAH